MNDAPAGNHQITREDERLLIERLVDRCRCLDGRTSGETLIVLYPDDARVLSAIFDRYRQGDR